MGGSAKPVELPSVTQNLYLEACVLRGVASGTLSRGCLHIFDAFVHTAEEDQEMDMNSSGYKLYDPVFGVEVSK